MSNKVLYILLGFSVILNILSGIYISSSIITETVNNEAIKSVGSYIYHAESGPSNLEPNSENKYSFGTLTTKVIPDFEIPQNLDVSVNKASMPLDTATLKKEIPHDSILLKIDISGSPMSNELNESTILAYSTKIVDQIIQDEKDRAQKAKSGYETAEIKEGITLLRRNNSYGANGDSSIELFQEIYLVDVSRNNIGLLSAPKTFLLIPTHYSDDQLDILKKNFDKISIIDLPYHTLPVF